MWLSASRTQRRLQHVSVLLAAADGLDVRGVHQPPEVVAVVAAVQTETQAHPGEAHHRGDAHRGGIARVVGFEFHAHFEIIGRGHAGLGDDKTVQSMKCLYKRSTSHFCYKPVIQYSHYIKYKKVKLKAHTWRKKLAGAGMEDVSFR